MDTLIGIVLFLGYMFYSLLYQPLPNFSATPSVYLISAEFFANSQCSQKTTIYLLYFIIVLQSRTPKLSFFFDLEGKKYRWGGEVLNRLEARQKLRPYPSLKKSLSKETQK